MECYRCPHREDVKSGKYRRVPFEETPCAGCQLDERPRYVVAFDEDRPGAEGGEEFSPSTGLRASEQGAEVEGEELNHEGHEEHEGRREGEAMMMPVWVLTEVVTELLEMPPALRDLVCWRLAGFKYREIGALQGASVEALENRHRRAMVRWPALRALFVVKAAKRKSRKRREDHRP